MEEEILKIIYKFYPKNLDSNLDFWLQTKNYQQLKNSIKIAQQNFVKWNAFIDNLEKTFLNKHEVKDWTQFFNHDACYTSRLSFSSIDNEYVDIAINLSVISNYYSIYCSKIKKVNNKYSLPEIDFDLKLIPKEFIKKIEDTICKEFPNHTKFPKEHLLKIVPDISLGNKNFGEVTFFDCIFTTHVW